MEYYRRHFQLEAWVVISGVLVSAGLYFAFVVVFKTGSEKLSYVAVLNTGLLFVIGHVYSRLKDRRDGKRKRAQELFLEWHTKDIRDSRIYVSRWRRVHKGTSLPSLSQVEELAAARTANEYAEATASAEKAIVERQIHPLDNPEEMELHFFRIYQFFERWSLLVQRSDVDHRLASEYMNSYKDWYLNSFITPWLGSESDPYIATSLKNIVAYVAPPHGEHDG